MAEEDLERVLDLVDDFKAGIQVVDSVGELIEASKSEVEAAIETEFTAIFDALEQRENALLKRCETLATSKGAALQAHSEKLELMLKELGETEDAEAALKTCKVEVLETVKIATMEDPIFEGEAEESLRDQVEAFGTIGDTGGLKVTPMLDAVVSFPRCRGFFNEVLGLVSNMPADAQAGLIEAADMEMLVAMLEEYKVPEIMERACMAVCNVAGQNPELSEEFGQQGGVAMVLDWLTDEQLLESTLSEEVIAAVCLTIGVLAENPENEKKIHENEGALKLMAAMEELKKSVEVQENGMYALGTIGKTSMGRQQLLENDVIQAFADGLTHYMKEPSYLEKAMRALYHVGDMHSEAKTQMLKAGIPATLASILKTHESQPTVVEGVCGVISMLIRRSAPPGAEELEAKAAMELLLNEQIFPLLLNALAAFSTELSLSRVILGIFSNFGLLVGKDAQLVKRAGFVDQTEAGAGAGVGRLVDAMRVHSRSMDIMESGCNAIWCLAKAEERLKIFLRESGAIELILKGMGSFSHSAEFCARACAALWCLAFKDPQNKTLIGATGGVETVVEVLKKHCATSEAVCEHGNICIANIVANHRVNCRLAGQVGAVKVILKLLKAHMQSSPVICFTSCNALIALCQTDYENQVRYARLKGPEILPAIREAHGSKKQVINLVQHLTDMGNSATLLKNAPVTSNLPPALGKDGLNLLARGLGKKSAPKGAVSKMGSLFHIDLVQAGLRCRCIRQQIVKFSAAGKDPKKISKWRLVNLDDVDITVYGGEDERSMDAFSKELLSYPLAKVAQCKQVANYKAAVTIVTLKGDTGTLVCERTEDAKAWVSAINTQMPGRRGTVKLAAKPGQSNGKEHYIACVHDYLFVYESKSYQAGDLVEMIPCANMLAVYVHGGSFVLTTDKHTFVFLVSKNEAVGWETFLLGMIAGSNSRLRQLTKAALAGSEPGPPPPDEPPPAYEDDDDTPPPPPDTPHPDDELPPPSPDTPHPDGEASYLMEDEDSDEEDGSASPVARTLPEGYSAEIAAELDAMLADSQAQLAKEANAAEELEKRLKSAQSARKRAENRLQRVVEEIRKQKAVKAGTYDDAAALDTTAYSKKNFMARFAKFESIATMAADSARDGVISKSQIDHM